MSNLAQGGPLYRGFSPSPVSTASLVLTFLDILLLGALPYLFALFCVLRASVALAFGRGDRPARLALHLILTVWGIAHLVALLHTGRVWGEGLYAVGFAGLGLIFLGYVASSRLRRSVSPSEAVRRSTVLGAELAIVWFVGRLLMESWPDVPVATWEVACCLLIIAGSMVRWPGRAGIRSPESKSVPSVA